MYACMYLLCMHVCACVCMYVCMYVCIWLKSYIWSQFIYPYTIYTHEYISYTTRVDLTDHQPNIKFSNLTYCNTILTYEEDLSALKNFS